MKSLGLVSLFALVASCGASTPLPTPESADIEDASKDDGVCIHRHKSCTLGGERCCTGYCNATGYGPGQCVAPLADGAACYEDVQCSRKHCNDGICGEVAVCVDLGGTCKSATDCCTGFCDLYNAYLPSWRTCVAPLPNGSSCETASQCQSGLCTDYVCVAAACASSGASCASDGDCCAGSFCHDWTYAPPVCLAAQANGAHCQKASQCQSGVCTDYVCVAH